jgi:hypothetical protein
LVAKGDLIVLEFDNGVKMITIIDKNSTSQKLTFHLDITLDITAAEARRRVNRQIVVELGTGMIAQEPELIIADEQIAWRVPIELSLPALGNLGKVGEVKVNRGPVSWPAPDRSFPYCFCLC